MTTFHLFASSSLESKVLLSTVVGHASLTVIMTDVATDLTLTGSVLWVDLVLAEGTLFVLVGF